MPELPSATATYVEARDPATSNVGLGDKDREAISQECVVCEMIKPASQFYTNKLAKSGLLNRCKTCHIVDSAKRQALRKLEKDEADRKDIIRRFAAALGTSYSEMALRMTGNKEGSSQN